MGMMCARFASSSGTRYRWQCRDLQAKVIINGTLPPCVDRAGEQIQVARVLQVRDVILTDLGGPALHKQ